jgi:DNA replication protein DnaC
MYKLEDLKIRRKAWVKAANINPNRLGWLLDDCTVLDEKYRKKINTWLDLLESGQVVRAVGNNRCGKGLMLWGEPGHGKTTIALAIIQEIMTRFPLEAFDVKEGRVLIRPCYFITFNDVLNLKGSLMDDADDDQQILYQGILGDCPNDSYNIRVLIIDDIGKEHASLSGWQKSMLHHVLRTRFNNGLPTIVTTNVEIENWGSTYDVATESFAHESFAYLPIKTSDLRVRK